jgi:ribonuclease R
VDVEAYQRGTSVYFPTRVIPMLPERLSNNLCSLVPDEDRYTFTAMLDFDQHGKRLAKRFMKSIIRSRHRLTYTTVKQALTDKDPEVLTRYAEIIPALEMMGSLALRLENQRIKRGSIGFEIPEPLVVLGEDNTVETIKRSERNQAHKLIEEFMLAANEAVALTLTEGRIDSLYRIHEPPDPLKVAEFTEFAQGMGLNIEEGDGSPQWFGKVLAMAAGTPREYIISNLLLRTMQQARYSPHNVGHFGLAATHYTHFTSPIRRYPDLMVHRALAASLRKKGPAKPSGEPVSSEEAGTFLSKRERVAVEADREMMERLQVHFMADRIGETFEAVVSGVTAFGLFVELIEVSVHGAVPITEMRDDYYELEEARHRLIGQRTRTVFQLGDLVRVRLTSVEIPRRRINFSVEEKLARATDILAAPAAGKPQKGAGKGSRKPAGQTRKR